MIKILSSGKVGIKRPLKNDFKSGPVLIAVNKKARLIKMSQKKKKTFQQKKRLLKINLKQLKKNYSEQLLKRKIKEGDLREKDKKLLILVVLILRENPYHF
jgi:hypothetical protein